MALIVDRRLNSKNKSAINRQRFIQRFRKQIKAAVENAISKRSITNIENGERIILPRRDIAEPQFQQGIGGKREVVFVGNKEFMQGDHVKRPQSETGSGNQASDQGEGLDEFGFELTKEEFVELFFEDLALPDLIKTRLQETPTYKYVRAGFSNKGIPPNINILRTFKNALSRRIAFSGNYKNKLNDAEEELKIAENMGDLIKAEELKQKIVILKRKIQAIPFIDDFDLRYNYRIKQPKPNTQAVMFCIMDVSGSMDEAKKEIAKRFFILLYLFLTRTYERIDIVFIRHHTTAKEVDEEEFFYSRETGGTVVSSALELMKTILLERYPSDEWNVYAAQASDGDNWNADSPLCQQVLVSEIMPYLQYFAYVEIMPRHHQSLWQAYLGVKECFSNFAMQSINTIQEIYPVFHDLFKRKVA